MNSTLQDENGQIVEGKVPETDEEPEIGHRIRSKMAHRADELPLGPIESALTDDIDGIGGGYM